MEIGDLIPELRPLAEQVSQTLRYICFFLLTASIITKAARPGGHSISMLMKPIITAALLTGIIATLPQWFNIVRDTFWGIAVAIRNEFASSISPTGTLLIQLIFPPEGGINWMDATHSMLKSIMFAIAWMVVCFGALIQLPMMLVQFVAECLCYMFLPIAVSMLSLETTRGLAVRYIQQTLAVLAWPIGFAIVDLVGYALLSGPYAALDNVLLGKGYVPALMLPTGLVALWLILGSLATPVLMQMLFCSGTPLSSAIGQSVQTGASIAGYIGLAKGVLASAMTQNAMAATKQASGSAGGGGSPGGGALGSGASSSESGCPPSAESRHHQSPSAQVSVPPSANDPYGDQLAASILATQRIPQPVRY
ncbi:hypothetical protein DB346_23200 [Verrucomicrobia bacterium LW23]|nr:hypothetical protein DB346_23200 [Verrucomicrobia bacterium LW23]